MSLCNNIFIVLVITLTVYVSLTWAYARGRIDQKIEDIKDYECTNKEG